MRVDTLRERFAGYLQEKGLDTAILLDASLTVGQDSTLRYERIDKYRVLHVRGKELDGLMRECSRLGLCLWLGAGKLCIGYEHRENMRLSAYESVVAGHNRSGLPIIAGIIKHDDENGAVSTPVPPPTFTG